MKKKTKAEVLESSCMGVDIWQLVLQTELAGEAGPGQFIGVYPNNPALLLPRPISICEVNEEKSTLRLVYRIAGKGTEEFSKLQKGEEISILGILGNGFPVDKGNEKQVILCGGGIGIPPLLELAKKLNSNNINIVLGYRDENAFLAEEFKKYGKIYIATEDGSIGIKGNVTDAIKYNKINCDIIYSCGPMPMLKAVKRLGMERGVPTYLSLEERMACGVGACLGCVCKTVRKDAHSNIRKARICTEGPVFEASEVRILPEDEEV